MKLRISKSQPFRRIRIQKHKNMLRIIISNYDDLKNPYYAGGGALAIHNVCKQLVKHYNLLVLTGNYNGAKDEIIDGVQYKRVGFSVGNPKLDQIIYQVCLHFRALFEKYDLWFESLTPPFSFSLLPILTKKPVVAIVHMLSGKDMRRKYHLPFDVVQNFGLKLYRHFIVLSKKSRADILKVNKTADIRVIPNGVDIPKKVDMKKENTIIFIGRIEINQKGLDLLLHAWKKAELKIDAKLVIAGSGQNGEVEKLKKLINDLKLNKSVKYVGRVENRSKDALFRKSLFVVSPSRFETFGVTALEAMSYSLPFLCFDIDGYKWIPKSNCLKVKKFDIKSFSDSIIRLISNVNYRKSLSSKSKKFVKQYKWSNIVQRYQDYINGLFNKNIYDSNKIIDTIIKNKRRCVFVSPHFDDAALSAGGFLTKISENKKVVVINVFTKGNSGPYTLSASKFLQLSDVYDANYLYEKRAIEDQKALKKKNIQIINLGFVDATFRTINTNIFRKTVGKIIPEMNYVYPIYRLNVLHGKISINDKVLLENLAVRLSKIIKNDDIVFAPLGIGGHVDHRIVNQIVRKLKNTKVFWRDFPYSSYVSEEIIGNKRVLIYNGEQKSRELMIRKYVTQVNSMFPSGEIELTPEVYCF